MTTVLEILDKGTSYLEKRDIEDARRNMQMLVAHQLGCTRMQLYLRFDEPIDPNHLEPLRLALKRRGEGVPLQHLLGSVEFFRREFKSDARALIPRPETEELVEILVRQFPPPQDASILDMGCGSGVLGLSLAAEFPHSHVTLADLSADALHLARENAASLEITNTSFIESHLFSHIPHNSRFNLIVANLPYVPDTDRHTLSREVLHDPHLALFSGQDGLDLIRTFIPAAASHLHPGGLLALEIGIGQSHAVESLLLQAGLTDVLTLNDLSGIPRFPLARKPTP